MSENEVTVRRHKNGIMSIETDDFYAEIQIRAETPAEKYEIVRAAILRKGLVFTEKVEKQLRKELNFWA